MQASDLQTESAAKAHPEKGSLAMRSQSTDVERLDPVRMTRRPLLASFRGAVVALAVATVLGRVVEARPALSIPVGKAPSPGLITVCVNGDIWSDGGFEATDKDFLTNSNYPVVFSTHFPTGHPAGTPPSGTPLCNVLNADCQDGSNMLLTPRNGNSWAWFGGNNVNDGAVEISYAEQTITFPPPGSSVTLNFYLRIGFVTSPFTDTLEVQVDGTTLVGGTFTEPTTAESGYTLRAFDLTAYADGGAHAIRFSYTQAAPADNNKANFDVDDVSLDIVCAGASPTALAVDAIGNGILEPNETVIVQPTWKNTGGAPLPLTGTSSNFTGPAGPTYINPDTSADYGTISTGASAQCTNCYTVHITEVNRPVTPHWDATINELLSTGAAKMWTLHVGDSFTDVPHDLFYKPIETILHNGVTGGCGSGMFCPSLLTSRAQMAVFLLTAEHGAGYVPPACTGVFTDVECTPTPAFAVNFIEQLYNEGITGGCNLTPLMYCPDSPIPRAQMAVFLLLAEHGPTYVPPVCTGVFTDVECTPTPAFAVNFIEQLYNEGITGGCSISPKLYCPTDSTPRGQMAVFLTTTFHLLLYGP